MGSRNLNLPLPKRLTYVSDKHPRRIITAFKPMYRYRENCDVILNIDTHKIFAHRDILSACSPYFRAMFTGNMAESQQTEITIHDMDGIAMERLIEFCYTAEITLKSSNVQTLLPAACFLQLTEVEDMCCEFLRRELAPSNCLSIRALAETYSCLDLLRIVDNYIHSNFQEVIKNEEFLYLSVTQLIDIIASDKLNVKTEELVFCAVISWVNFDLSERRQNFPQVLQHVRLSLLSPIFLVGTVGTNLLISTDERCKELVDEAKYHLLFPEERIFMQGPHTRPREPTERGQLLCAIGGWCNDQALNSVECYDPETGLWKLLAHMNKPRCEAGIAVLNNLLYAVGGFDGKFYLKCSERYNPQTNRWSRIASSNLRRSSLGVAVLHGSLYAIGGQTNQTCSNCVERYDPIDNRWTSLTPLTSGRLGVAVIVLGRYLYAIGGSDNQNSTLSSVERYDRSQDTWTEMAPMLTKRKHFGCAIYKDMIYAVGGQDDETELSSAERYNPFTNSWSPIGAMTSRRNGLGLVVVNEKLYAIGGFNGKEYLNTIEVFDQDHNQWRLCGKMRQKRIGVGAGAMRSPKPNYSF